jgi:hypothetical protein
MNKILATPNNFDKFTPMSITDEWVATFVFAAGCRPNATS